MTIVAQSWRHLFAWLSDDMKSTSQVSLFSRAATACTFSFMSSSDTWMRTYQGFNPNLSLLLQCRMMHFDAALLMVLLIDVHHSFSKRSSNKWPTRVFKPMFIKSISCNSPVGLLKSTLAISPPSAIMLLSMWIAQNKDFCLHQNSFSSLSSAHEKQEQTQKRFVYNFVECRYFSVMVLECPEERGWMEGQQGHWRSEYCSKWTVAPLPNAGCYLQPLWSYWFCLFCVAFVNHCSHVLCQLWVINIPRSEKHFSLVFFLCDCPFWLDLFCVSCSAGANLPHQCSFALLFHPSTLGQTVCSKDSNLRIIFMSFCRAGHRGHI